MNAVASNGAHSHFSLQHSSFSLRPSRLGLTLIELLVTIVIMVTVLAGALPLLSPNNNSRKLREASRQLNSLLSQAQAQAARDGRPVGVGFRESGTVAPHSGMALEAYLIAEPQPFTGFSENSRVHVEPLTSKYGAGGNGGTRFPKYVDRQMCRLVFGLMGGATPSPDPFPPNMLRIGDVIDVGGNIFVIADDGDQKMDPNEVDVVNGVEYLLSDGVSNTEIECVWINSSGQQLPVGSPGRSQQFYRPYLIRRQPGNTSEQPLQFPRGIGIDLQASGAVGLSVPEQFDEMQPIPAPPTKITPLTISVMFSPNGSLDTLYVDGVRKDGVEQIYFLMGLFENGNSEAQDAADYDFTAGTSITDDELAQRRTRINWLNPDSRWVSVNRAGRIITTDNNISFNPRVAPFSDSVTGTEQEQNRARLLLQVRAARQNASNMSGSTGR